MLLPLLLNLGMFDEPAPDEPDPPFSARQVVTKVGAARQVVTKVGSARQTVSKG